MKKVVLASDHAACGLKNQLKNYVISKGYEVVDLGPADDSVSVSYAHQGHKMANYINEHKNDVDFGLAFCGTGLGISYALNRHHDIRAARVASVQDAELAKLHNDANVLVMGGRQVSFEEAKAMLDKYMATSFEGGRHLQRIEDIEKLDLEN
ncbi:RpiB/LacA/LacB family sugar-phosphate isomerase [Mycoplasmopsis gallinarum]|uniref:RpiB/LacA/LacB family sugar-phosphate isomerase n=1 Tax=Mycoplasmopsis gallinarum TaxID=29557 RepID=UPI0004821B61|nr:RpiB/LacA/LacB family sugar-phosphate isomerase [Mycoplasmopsis gallinarum]